MATVTLEGDTLVVKMSILDEALSFHGSFHIPLAHITSAHTGNRKDLELHWRLLGTGAGSLKTAGIFTTPEGHIFCDLSGNADCLVLETRGERFPRLALTLDPTQDPNTVAQEIERRRK